MLLCVPECSDIKILLSPAEVGCFISGPDNGGSCWAVGDLIMSSSCWSSSTAFRLVPVRRDLGVDIYTSRSVNFILNTAVTGGVTVALPGKIERSSN